MRSAGHLVATHDALWAVYVLDPVSHSLTGPQTQLATQRDQQDRWAELAGHRCKLLVVPRPWPAALWARDVDERHAATRLPDPPEGETWARYLVAGQAAAQAVNATVTTTILQVRIGRFHPNNLKILVSDETVSAEWQAIRERVAKLDRSVARAGFNGSPIQPRHLEWLLHATLAPGVTPPPVPEWGGDLTPADIADVNGTVTIDAEPYAGHARIHALRGAGSVDVATAVLTLGRIKPREEVGPQPWLAGVRAHDVSLCATFDVIGGEALVDMARSKRRALADNIRHFDEHEETPPQELERAYADARRFEDQVSAGTPEVATRLVGVVRVAVSAPPERIRARVDAFIADQARTNGLGWVPTHAHVRHLSEWEIASDYATSGMRRWIPAQLMAAGVPNLETRVGSPYGPMLGHTMTRPATAVLWEPTHGPSINRSGLSLIMASLGGGKSVLSALLADQAAWGGSRVVIIDPSGPMSRLAQMPHLRGQARVMDLLNARRGALNPYLLVPEPERADYPSDGAFVTASTEATAERRALMADVIGMLLPSVYTTGANGGDVLLRIQAAVFEAPGHYGASPWDVIGVLQRSGGMGSDIARAIQAVADNRGANLIFPWSGDPEVDLSQDDAVTIITTPGLRPAAPEANSSGHRTWEETIAGPIFSLAAWLAQRAMYSGGGSKCIVLDEASLSGSASSMRALMVRGSRDSRKHNAAVIIASQNPGDFTRISPEIANLADSGFIGRMESASAAEDALRVLGLPLDAGLQRLVRKLEPGQFLVKDWMGRAGVIQSIAKARPEFFAAAQTTPRTADPTRVDEVIL